MSGIQMFETQADGTKVPVTAFFHKDESEGLTRKVVILELGEGEREGMAYVQSQQWPWVYQGYRGFKKTHVKWVKCNELTYSTEQETK